jgi:hypothetical protein
MPFTVADSITGFAWGRGAEGEVYVAVSASGVIGYSRDGDIWEGAGPAPKVNPTDPEPYDPFDSSDPIHFNAVAYGGGVFIAVGNEGKIAYSSNGIRWTAGPSGGITGFGTTNIYGIAYGTPGSGGAVFVAVGGNANIACSGDGGLTWAGGSVSSFSGVRLNDICFGGGAFYVVGNSGHRGRSDNPASAGSWQHYKSDPRNTSTYPNEKDDPGCPFFGNNLTRIAYGMYGSNPGLALTFDEWGGRRIAVAAHDKFSSKDWDADINSEYFGNNSIRGIAYGGGNFVAAGTGSIIGFWPSADNSNDYNRYWRALPFYEFRYWEITALAALNGRFYAGNIGGKIGYSK